MVERLVEAQRGGGSTPPLGTNLSQKKRKMKKILFGIMLLVSVSAEARDQIRIVGSSTLYPFSTVVAERFGKSTDFKTPIVESTGSGAGIKLFCAGIGPSYPDIANSSRRIKQSEINECAKNGIQNPMEVKVGYDGIILASSNKGKSLSLTLKQLFMALAAEVPINGELVQNPYTMWNEIDGSLPKIKIEVLGPPPTSGTRDAFVELAMRGGAMEFESLRKILDEGGKSTFHSISDNMREDGHFIEAGENDNLIVRKLGENPNAYGILGFGFLDQNEDKIQGSSIDGVEPTFDNIADGLYGISRSLFFYVKSDHVGVIPGIIEYTNEFISDGAAGNEGYLTDKGLIPLSDTELKQYREKFDKM